MSSVTRPRGPLPPGVYWRRRLIVLFAALVLVFGFARVLGGGSDAKGGSDGTAEQAAGGTSGDTSTPAAPGGSTDQPTTKPTKKGPKATPKNTPTKTPLAEPDGPCDDADVEVTPAIRKPIAGSPIRIGLVLRTKESEACTWRAAKDTLVVKITSGSDDIWSTQDCPNAIMAEDVVVRRAAPTVVYAIWSSRRSDDECGKRTDWANLGWYHVIAAALGGEPTDVQFELRAPQPPTITPSPSRTPTRSPSKGASQPTDEPNPNPSDGAQEPNG
ncbi:hypothetical protein [Nocardioides speluncae]|uniref:hypothetical protein n=1 Tax=Nocardioides speluncae TaxID=2670337 RepID=UPI0012B17A2C|nr:hypothetical protein [Nocardioides speluncae]